MSLLTRRRPSAALAALAVAASVMLAPAPAAAHPSGDPQTLSIARDDKRPEVVRVRWRAGGPDDLTLLGVSLGLLPPDRVLLDGAVDYRSTDPALIASSEEFSAYLLRQITVADAARPCVGAVTESKALARAGVTLDYTCPEPVERVTVGVRMLTDLNPAYRAVATGPGGQHAAYGSGNDSHDWTLVGTPTASSTERADSTDPGRSTERGRSAEPGRGVALAGALLVAAMALLMARRRRAAA